MLILIYPTRFTRKIRARARKKLIELMKLKKEELHKIKLKEIREIKLKNMFNRQHILYNTLSSLNEIPILQSLSGGLLLTDNNLYLDSFVI